MLASATFKSLLALVASLGLLSMGACANGSKGLNLSASALTAENTAARSTQMRGSGGMLAVLPGPQIAAATATDSSGKFTGTPPTGTSAISSSPVVAAGTAVVTQTQTSTATIGETLGLPLGSVLAVAGNALLTAPSPGEPTAAAPLAEAVDAAKTLVAVVSLPASSPSSGALAPVIGAVNGVAQTLSVGQAGVAAPSAAATGGPSAAVAATTSASFGVVGQLAAIALPAASVPSATSSAASQPAPLTLIGDTAKLLGAVPSALTGSSLVAATKTISIKRASL